ncbi:MAG TPA: glycogen/starch synthase [Candidatus Dormibacteraeota bacterium]
MPRSPLAVAVVWHMHQPWYRDDVAGQFVLPWVRRRASKDYLHMLRILERHPDIRVTINMVPSLLAQLELYAAGDVADADRELCLREAADLTAAERDFLVAGAKHADYGRRVVLLRPYMELVNRLPVGDTSRVSVDDIRDLQLWTLLAWIDPEQIGADADLHVLAERGRGFSEDDKTMVDFRQLALLRAVVPAYRAAVASGQVEPLTTPYHHPILPLLIDPACARVATPEIELPPASAHHPADAEEHVRRGLAEFARITGHPAAGMWPAECAVSPAAAALMHSCGAGFAISDEGVLARTLGRDSVADTADLYRAYRETSGLRMVFRDARLSNLIGFTYQSMPAEQAAADLLERLEALADARSGGDAQLVTIGLDGENFKDFYEDNATPFLDAFYTGLAASSRVQSTHIGAFLDAHPEAVRALPELWTGSWIDADLRTWIGEPAHTRAWTLLASSHDALDRAGGAAEHQAAHEELLIAQASDWYWWFGEHHDSGSDAAWDALFRTHLRNAHALAGLAVPPELNEPVIDGLQIGNDCPPLRTINPPAAGPTEWQSAGIAEVGAALGAMRPPASSVSRVLYGAGGGRLHLRFGDHMPRYDRAVIDAGSAGRLVVDRAVRNLSVALPAGAVDFTITLQESGRGAERVPSAGSLHAQSPPDGPERPLRVVLVAAECAPLATAGELAALVAETAEDAAALGHDVVVAIPLHRGAALGVSPGVRVAELRATVSGRLTTARIVQAALPGSGVPVLSVDAPAYFDRDAIYGAVDDGERYLAFCALVAALLAATAFAPDVVHGFEWQTAALLGRLAGVADPPATVFSVGEGSASYRVDATAVSGVGVRNLGVGEVDLSDLGRRAATVVEPTPRRDTLSALYDAALHHRQPR